MGWRTEEQKQRIHVTFQRRKDQVLIRGWMRKGEESHIISVFLI